MQERWRRWLVGTQVVLVAGVTLSVLSPAPAVAQPYCQSTQNHPQYGTFYDCMVMGHAGCAPGVFNVVLEKTTPAGRLQLLYNGNSSCRHVAAAVNNHPNDVGSYLNL